MDNKTFYIISILIGCLSSNVFAFDHKHKIWNQLLKQYIHYSPDGFASKLDYKEMKNNESKLNNYLNHLSNITQSEFSGWSKNQQKAFLINAYNAFTVKLILSNYSNIKSIKDLGSFFSSPWNKDFFTLLGKPRSLDDVEHKLLREPGVYNDPYIHVAVVCASIGCPALRDEAFTGEKIEQQLSDNMQRFLSDKPRNRYNPQSQRLEVSKIFDWYEEDFTKGHRGINSLNELFALYAKQLTDDKASQELITKKTVKIDYLDYDWKLNDI